MNIGKKGFTLIELMIVVAIVAIIAAIAYPNYQAYVKRTKRVEVQTHMMQVAQNLENYKLANNSYAQASLLSYGGTQFPIQGTANYSIQLTDGNGVVLTSNDANTQSWLLVARPLATSGQKGTGAISINSNAIKCWYKDNDAAQVTVSKDQNGQVVAPNNCTETW